MNAPHQGIIFQTAAQVLVFKAFFNPIDNIVGIKLGLTCFYYANNTNKINKVVNH